jgi:hypothetical protein
MVIEDKNFTLEDWRGRLIGVGDAIVYPGYGGSHLWMTEAWVTAIGQEKEKFYFWVLPFRSTPKSLKPRKEVKLTNLSRVTKI